MKEQLTARENKEFHRDLVKQMREAKKRKLLQTDGNIAADRHSSREPMGTSKAGTSIGHRISKRERSGVRLKSPRPSNDAEKSDDHTHNALPIVGIPALNEHENVPMVVEKNGNNLTSRPCSDIPLLQSSDMDLVETQAPSLVEHSPSMHHEVTDLPLPQSSDGNVAADSHSNREQCTSKVGTTIDDQGLKNERLSCQQQTPSRSNDEEKSEDHPQTTLPIVDIPATSPEHENILVAVESNGSNLTIRPCSQSSDMPLWQSSDTRLVEAQALTLVGDSVSTDLPLQQSPDMHLVESQAPTVVVDSVSAWNRTDLPLDMAGDGNELALTHRLPQASPEELRALSTLFDTEFGRHEKEKEEAAKLLEHMKQQIKLACQKEIELVENQYQRSVQSVETAFWEKKKGLDTMYNTVSINTALARAMRESVRDSNATRSKGMHNAITAILMIEQSEQNELTAAIGPANQTASVSMANALPVASTLQRPNRWFTGPSRISTSPVQLPRASLGQQTLPSRGNFRCDYMVRALAPHLRQPNSPTIPVSKHPVHRNNVRSHVPSPIISHQVESLPLQNRRAFSSGPFLRGHVTTPCMDQLRGSAPQLRHRSPLRVSAPHLLFSPNTGSLLPQHTGQPAYIWSSREALRLTRNPQSPQPSVPGTSVLGQVPGHAPPSVLGPAPGHASPSVLGRAPGHAPPH